MDAATRRELDDLRRRAYGPQPDIDDAGMARLALLEDEARRDAAPAASPGARPAERAARLAPAGTLPAGTTPTGTTPTGTTPTGATAAAPATAAATTPAHAAPSTPRRRAPLLPIALAVAGLLVAAYATPLLVEAAAPASAPDPTPAATASATAAMRAPGIPAAAATPLISIRLEGSFGRRIDIRRPREAGAEPIMGETPAFPSQRPLAWALDLGDYYGWELWIAGGLPTPGVIDDDREHCVLLRRDAQIRGDCEPLVAKEAGALHVTLDGVDIPVAETPAEMEPFQEIRFWWLADGTVRVVLGDFDSRRP
ncbi:hypothetical protein [Microbacterium hominis]|uniref:Uncharacterized protein n=1 Tax=Microbacterium hominis TaxID=162426 RepID=A0A7D4PX42_9MICO|nr:hypothetical protein [Microbacterium hominis]QKJ20734.1 hypothetical protein HQM25_16145 [Microbacterium hominis]